MIARTLVATSSLIVALLGLIHLFYTFWGDKLLPRDVSLREAMSQAHMVITRETTVWKAWVGFNVSHSLCAILFGAIYLFFALNQPDTLFSSIYLQCVGLALLITLVVLAKLYWFSVPCIGVSIALGCYIAGLVTARVIGA